MSPRIVTLRGRRFLIEFPFSWTVVEAVRKMPGRRWHPDERLWSVPATARVVTPLRAFGCLHDFDLSQVEGKLTHLEQLRVKRLARFREWSKRLAFSPEQEDRSMSRLFAQEQRANWRERKRSA